MSNWIFVDVEALGTSPINGVMMEFGAVHEPTRKTFHGAIYESRPNPNNPVIPEIVFSKPLARLSDVATAFVDWLAEVGGKERPIFVSDNPAFDFMWIAGMFDVAGIDNPFGNSGRRISDFWAGLQHNWGDTQSWKNYRQTPHDHNPVNDAMGNVEAFREIMTIAKRMRLQ